MRFNVVEVLVVKVSGSLPRLARFFPVGRVLRIRECEKCNGENGEWRMEKGEGRRGERVRRVGWTDALPSASLSACARAVATAGGRLTRTVCP